MNWPISYLLDLDFISFYGLYDCIRRNDARNRLVTSRLNFLAAQAGAEQLEKHLGSFSAILNGDKEINDQAKFLKKVGGGF